MLKKAFLCRCVLTYLTGFKSWIQKNHQSEMFGRCHLFTFQTNSWNSRSQFRNWLLDPVSNIIRLDFLILHVCDLDDFHIIQFFSVNLCLIFSERKKYGLFCKIISITYIISKVEKILKGSLDLFPSPSPSVKIQIMGWKVCLRCKGKT